MLLFLQIIICFGISNSPPSIVRYLDIILSDDGCYHVFILTKGHRDTFLRDKTNNTKYLHFVSRIVVELSSARSVECGGLISEYCNYTLSTEMYHSLSKHTLCI